MKKQTLLSLVMIIFLFSCQKQETFDLNPEEESSNNQQNQSIVFQRILDLGFSKNDIVDYKDYYVVEGDIVFLKSDTINNESSKLKQARTNNVVSVTKTTIYVYLNSNLSGLVNMDNALNGAISQYNSLNCDLKFIRTTSSSNANISISRNDNLGTDVCGMGGFPFSDGRPYNSVQISQATLTKYNLTSYNQLVFLLVHEMGHNIGLRHTNWSSSGESAGSVGANQIAGTPTSDNNSVMNSGTCGFTWNGFSNFDRIAITTMYPLGKCPYMGSYDGANCYVGTPPQYTNAFIYSNNFYYTGAPTCSANGSGYDGAHCKFATAPNNIWKYNGGYYYNAVNGNQCPVAGTWYDGAHCQFPIPANSSPFVLNSKDMYYNAVYNQCPRAGSWWDGANCCIGAIPSQAKPFIYNNNWYVKPGAF